MDIDKLEAGRGADALVACQVMGWTNIEMEAYVPYGRDVCGTVPGAKDGVWLSGRRAVPKFSTDIAAAWEVVEKYGIRWIIDAVPAMKTFRARCENEDTLFIGDGDTAPLAICRAALKAVEK